MDNATLDALQDEFTKLAQGEGLISKARRRIGVAGEFASPTAEAALLGLAARGLGIRNPRHLLSAAGLGAAHGVVRKTKKYAG